MLRHYFVTGLKPVALDHALPMSPEDFLMQASSCVSEKILFDLTMLSASKDIDRAIKHAVKRNDIAIKCSDLLFLHWEKGSTSIPIDAVWPTYWRTVHKTCHSKFVRRIADEAATFFKALALKMSRDDSFMHASIAMCFQHSDPVMRERALGEAFIAMLEKHANADAFSDDQLFVYYLKLLMIERFASFDAGRGQAQLERLVARIVEGISL